MLIEDTHMYLYKKEKRKKEENKIVIFKDDNTNLFYIQVQFFKYKHITNLINFFFTIYIIQI